jgi:hypothetical protein
MRAAILAVWDLPDEMLVGNRHRFFPSFPQHKKLTRNLAVTQKKKGRFYSAL